MNEPKTTYVATCRPFVVSENLQRRRELARQAKKRRDPGAFVIVRSLVNDVRSAILDFAPGPDDELAAWFGTADRLACAHPSKALELLAGEADDRLAFVTAVGPRSYWPAAEAEAYTGALAAFTTDRGTVEELASAAKSLVRTARQREAAWSREEWEFRILAAIMAWIYWDDEPGATPSR
jgi:hypothetical protein